jgi:hypothetical protein
LPHLSKRRLGIFRSSPKAPNFDAIADCDHSEIRTHFDPPRIGFWRSP